MPSFYITTTLALVNFSIICPMSLQEISIKRQHEIAITGSTCVYLPLDYDAVVAMKADDSDDATIALAAEEGSSTRWRVVMA